MLALLAVLVWQAPETARAESLLAAGALPHARAIAERLVARFPSNAHHHLLLGRIWLAWPVIGRYQALAEFRMAARLAPGDPEPLYRQMEVGFYLGSDEGEILAREAILGILVLDPDYRDSWTRFQQLFRNDRIARRADRALARHPHHAKALERRAELALALREPARAESLGAILLAHGDAPLTAFVLHAEAAFLDGRDSVGQVWYDSALAYGDVDSTGVLWDRAWTIASPDEGARYAATPPGERRRFLERFWALRDPNLLTPYNERLGEHVRRTADARYQFRLLHPFRMVYRSRDARAMTYFHERRRLMARTSRSTVDVQDLQDTAHAQAYRAGLDARGLTFVRHGPPDVRMPCALDLRYPMDAGNCTSGLDVEGWLYRTPTGLRSVGFREAEFFAPASTDQLRHTAALLRTDGTALPAPAAVRAWTAFFRSVEAAATEVYVAAAGNAAALVLWDEADTEIARRVGRGLLSAAVPPGHYRFGLDIDSAGALGRLRTAVLVPDLTPDVLRLSSLVVVADSANGDRTATLAAMPPDLTYAAGAALGAYLEVYGLRAIDGAVRYTARYTFEPARSGIGRLLRGTDPVSFEFERRAPAGTIVAERLELEPGRVPPGRYRVSVAVTDLERNVKSETAVLVVTLR